MKIGQGMNIASAQITGYAHDNQLCTTKSSLMDTAQELLYKLNRVDSAANRIKGLMFGLDPCGETVAREPQSLEELLHAAMAVVHTAERTLNGILSNLNND